VSLATFWCLASTPHYCWRAVISTSSSAAKQVVVARSKIRAVTKVVSWNSPAVLEYQPLYVEAHYHGGTLHRMSAIHASCSEWPAIRSFYCFVIHFWRYFGLFMHELHHQHPFCISENSCHQPFGKQNSFYTFFDDCLTASSLVSRWRKPRAHNSQWISMALVFFEWRKHITARISLLGRLQYDSLCRDKNKY
jgi:hypothetical protein